MNEDSISFEGLKVEEDFKEHVKSAIKVLKDKPERLLTFGKCKVPSSVYGQLLESALSDFTQVKSALRETFDLYEVYGRDQWGEILLTSYYSPIIEGRTVSEGEYNYPLFTIPSDLVEVEMKKFFEENLLDSINVRTKISGRIKKGWNGVERIAPYYSRAKIDGDFNLVSKKAKVLAYVKPIEAFFFHIQGSGLVKLKNGTLLSLGYAAQNGHRYYSIGKLLYDLIPKEEMTKAKIESYLYTLNERELFDFLGKNPSYVFFKKLKAGLGRTTFGPEVIERGTLAVDPSYISLGSLAFLEFDVPAFTNEKETVPVKFTKESRLVWAHDTGGAIKSAGRADLYWGRGLSAGQAAGVINQKARLWVLAPKVCRSNN